MVSNSGTRLRRYWAFAVVLFALVNLASLGKNLIFDERPRIDFWVFYDGGAAFAAGRSPYEHVISNKAAAFVYPQAWAAFVSPLTRFDKETASELWVWVSAGMLGIVALVGAVAGIRLARTERSGGESTAPLWALAAVAFFAAIGFTPAQFGIRLGQFEMFLSLLMLPLVIAPLYTPRASGWICGAALGIAAILKVSPAAMLPAVTFVLGWRTVAAFSTVILGYVATLGATGLLGREVYLFAHVVPQMQFTTEHPDHSLYRLIVAEWLGLATSSGWYGGMPTTLISILLLLAYVVVLFVLFRRRAHWLAFLAAGIGFTHLLSPVLEPHHFTSTLLVLVPAIVLFGAMRAWYHLAAVAACWYLGYRFIYWYNHAGADWPMYLLMVIAVLCIALALTWPASGCDQSSRATCKPGTTSGV